MATKQEVAKVSNKELIFEPENLTKETIKNFLCPLATDQELMMGLQVAKTCGLNPLKKEIYFIKYNANTPMATVTGYEVYLKRAECSGKYDGMELTSEGNIKDGSLKATIKVYRKDWQRPLVHEVYYTEYIQRKADGTPNKFWHDKPVTMIKKVAVSQAFRMAFPKETDGLPYTSDEMVDQEKIVDVNVEATSSTPEVKPVVTKPAPVKQSPPPEAVAEAEVVKPKPAPAVAPQPAQTSTVVPSDVKTVEGVIIDNKIKPFVANGKAGNKYGCKIKNEWYGSFDSKTYDMIVECQKNNRVVDIEYTEAPVTKDGKTTVYYNIVSLKEATMDGKMMEDVKENF